MSRRFFMSTARSLVERSVRRALSAIAVITVFLFATVVSVAIHIDTRPVHRLVARETNLLASRALVGDLRIERIDSITPTRIRVSRAKMLDRLGKPALDAEGLDVRFAPLALLRGILAGDAVRVIVPDVRAERVAVYLTRDEEKGGLTFETIFDMAASRPGQKKGKPASVALPRIAVDHAVVTTNQSGLEHATARVAELFAAVDVSPAGVFLSVQSDDAKIVDAFPGELRGRLRGKLRLPGTTRATFDGTIQGTPMAVSVAWRGPRIDVTARVDALDLRALDQTAPDTVLRGNADLFFDLGEDLKFDATALLSEVEVHGYQVAPMRIRGHYAHETLTASAGLLDPNLGTDVDVEVRPGAVEFASRSEDVNLAALARYGVAATGRVAVTTRGVVDSGRLDGSFRADFRSPNASVVRAEKATLIGRVAGPIETPGELAIDLAMEGERLAVGNLGLDRFRATTTGSLRKQSLSVGGTSEQRAALTASADVFLENTPSLSDVRVESRNGNSSVRLSADRVAFAPRLVIDTLSVRSGRGTLSGSIAAGGGYSLVDLTAANFDMGQTLEALGAHPLGISGRIDARAHLEETGRLRSGKASARVRDGAFPPFENVTANLVAEFDRSKVKANVEYALTALASGRLDASVSVVGSLFDPRALQSATGEAELVVDDVDIENASQSWLRDSGVALRGHARGSARVTRAQPDAFPTIAYELVTRGFSISRDAGSGDRTSEVRVEVDSAGDVLRADGSRFALNVADTEGTWIVASVQHSLDAAALAGSGKDGWKRAILEAPFRAHLTALPRGIELGAQTDVVRGTIAGAVDVAGSVHRPEINALASVTSPAARTGTEEEARLEASLEYSAEREYYDVEAHSTGERDRIDLESSGHFGWLDSGFGHDWSARGHAELGRLGVGRIGRLVNVPLEGEVSGSSYFDVGAGHIDAIGDIQVDRLSFDEHSIGSGTGRLKIGDDRAEANIRVESEQSSIELLGNTGLAWNDGDLRLDPRRGGMLRATVRDIDLRSIRRFVRSFATKLTGKLNGRGEIEWGIADTSGERSTTLRANATVTDATFSPVAGGGLFRNVRVSALADGDGPLRLSFSGAARSRAPNVNGTATVQFDGPRLKRLDAALEAKSFPLVSDGILVGRATTGPRAPLEVSVVSTNDGQTVDIHAPSVVVSLPKLNDKNLISLDDDSSIDVAEASASKQTMPEAPQETGSTALTVRFGDGVHIVRGGLDVPLGGGVTLSRNGRLTGAITLRQGGVVPALGQLFRIRRGEVRFEDQEASHGTLIIQAWTRVADGSVVDLDISGTIDNPTVSFHSDPPRSEDEIVAVLLGVQGDTVYKPSRNESQQVGRTAMALAMNRLLRDSALSGLQFGAGETGEGDTVSTVSLRVGSKVWLEGRSVRGNQTSVNPSERVSGVVDWRFAPTWSLRSQLGEVSGVEVRWSLRY